MTQVVNFFSWLWDEIILFINIGTHLFLIFKNSSTCSLKKFSLILLIFKCSYYWTDHLENNLHI